LQELRLFLRLALAGLTYTSANMAQNQ